VRNRTGDLMSRATNDLNAVRMVLGPGIMYTATTIATMVLADFLHGQAFALAHLVGADSSAICRGSRSLLRADHPPTLRAEFRPRSAYLSTRAQENLTGIRVIRAYVQEAVRNRLAFDAANREYVNRNIKLISSWSLFFPALSAMIGVTVVILLEAGGVQVIDHRVSLGTLSAFYAFLIQLVSR
jgi:ATP-binding cassette subfamily B multidrug efflux pump